MFSHTGTRDSFHTLHTSLVGIVAIGGAAQSSNALPHFLGTYVIVITLKFCFSIARKSERGSGIVSQTQYSTPSSALSAAKLRRKSSPSSVRTSPVSSTVADREPGMGADALCVPLFRFRRRTFARAWPRSHHRRYFTTAVRSPSIKRNSFRREITHSATRRQAAPWISRRDAPPIPFRSIHRCKLNLSVSSNEAKRCVTSQLTAPCWLCSYRHAETCAKTWT